MNHKHPSFLSSTKALLFSLLLLSLPLFGCGVFELSGTLSQVPTATPIPATAIPPVETTTPLPVSDNNGSDEVVSGVVDTPTPIPETAVPAENEAEQPQPALAGLYQDEPFGFQIQYPAGWTVTDVSAEVREQASDYAVNFTSWIPGVGGGGIPANGTKFDLLVYPRFNLSLADAVAQRRALFEQVGSETILLAEENLRLNETVEAVRLHTRSTFGEGDEFVTVINGTMLVFSGIGDVALLNQIVRTLRPFDTQMPPTTDNPTTVEAIQVNAGNPVTVYNGPGDGFSPVTMLPSGMALGVSGISADGLWYQLAGCNPKNPHRPAPTCWVTTAADSVSPIPALTLNNDTVWPSEVRMILVTAQEMAPLYSGPGQNYPQVSQLAGGFSFRVAGISENGAWWKLTDCSSPLNEPLPECWISADPAVTQATGVLPPTPDAATQTTTNTPQPTGIIPLTELPLCFDLDRGAVWAVDNPNCDFNLLPHESPGTLIFEPIPPARFAFGGVFPKAPSLNDCETSSHLREASEVIAPMATLNVCYHTGDNAFGYLTFLDMTDNPLAVVLSWKTFE